jgi:hypothetical protein
MLPRLPQWFAKLCLRLMLGSAAWFIPSPLAAADDVRFSATLSDSQRKEAGLGQLTPDNVAVIDALVRQDEATLKRRGSLSGFGTFSQRRSDHEREIAGLAQLTPTQLARLDGLAGLRISPPPAMILSEARSAKGTPGVLVRPVERPYALEVHGSMSLSYGWSSAGSTRGGEMIINLQDPAHRFSINIGYSQYQGSGVGPIYDPTDESYRYRPTAVTPLDR